MTLVITGRIAPMASGDPAASFTGSVFLAEGRVQAVRASGAPEPAGFAEAPRIDVGAAFVYPGLLDLHSHIGYASIPLWSEDSRPTPFLHHDNWPNARSYKSSVTWPAYLVAAGAPEALLVYAQVRALAGGTTAIQGWPSRNRNPLNRLVRSVDDEDLGTGDMVRTSALTLDDDELRERAERMEQGFGFIYHCGEGQKGSIVTREFDDVATTNCLRQNLIAIHMNALDGDVFRQWKERAELAGDDGPGTLVWSPFSNLWLYGSDETTDVAAARAAGIGVCLGTDWGPSGTKNLLGELKVARIWSEREGLGLTAFDLARMVTATPGDALARHWGAQAGRLVEDAVGDVAVIDARDEDPWENLVLAQEEDVLLVCVEGEARFGTRTLMRAAGQRATTSVDLGNRNSRHVALVDPADPDKRWYWSRVLRAIDDVRKDPAGALAMGLHARRLAADNERARRRDGVPQPRGAAGDPLILELDMPGPGGVRAGPPPDPASVVVPKAPGLRHDRPWRATLTGRAHHGGVLDELDRFYE